MWGNIGAELGEKTIGSMDFILFYAIDGTC